MSRTWKLLITVLVAGGMLVACGGDDDDDATTIGAEQCQDATAAFTGALRGASTLFTGESDQLRDAIDELEAFADRAPDDIKADFELVAEGYSEIVEVFADLDFDPRSTEPPDAETQAAIEALGKKFEDSDFERASENIEAWFEEHCGIAGE